MIPPRLIPYEPGVDLRAHMNLHPKQPTLTSRPSVAEVRQLIRDHSMSPRSVIALDVTMSTERVQNTLLIFLEDPPGEPEVMLFHVASWTPLPTIVSRCFVAPTLRLQPTDKRRLLKEEGFGDGQLKNLDFDLPYDDLLASLSPALGLVEEFLRALSNADTITTVNASRGFREAEARLLARVLRNHVYGNRHLALSHLSPVLLDNWIRILESLPSPACAVRWGAFQALGH